MEAFFQDNPGRVDVQHTYLGGKYYVAVLCYVVAGRPQAVAVQHSAHDISIGKQNGSRAVPGFHHGSIILIKIFFLLGHNLIVGPWLRNGDHHCQGQFHAVHYQELQGVVQHSGIRTGFIDYRKHFVQISLQHGRVHSLFPGQHFIHIAPDGINLSVVYDKTVGMRSLPAGVCVGAESGVNNGDSRFVVRTLKIREKGPKLSHQEHSLVNNGPAGERHYIGSIVGLLKASADYIEPPVEFQPLLYIPGSLHKGLFNTGHFFKSLMSQYLGSRRHLSPTKEGKAFPLYDIFKHFLSLASFQYILREEKHTDSVISLFT